MLSQNFAANAPNKVWLTDITYIPTNEGWLYLGWAGLFLDKWCNRTMRSRLKPMKKVAKMLRAHRPLLLNWFRAKGEIDLGCV